MFKQLTRLPYILCYLCAFVLGMKQLREPDIWWQLLSGRWMLDNNTITRTDEFSYTMQGAKWINVKWLYEVIIASIEKMLGPHGVMLLQSLVNVAIVFILLKIMQLLAKHLGRQLSVFYSVVAVLLFLAISEFRMAGRPEMVSHLFTAAYILILWQSPGFAWRRILWLIPLQCLWSNMHEAYPVGMAIIAAYISGGFISYLVNKNRESLQSTSRLGAVWAGMALAILANPNGIQLWKQPFEIFRQLKVNKYTTELFSVAAPEYWTIQGKLHIVMLAAVLLFWALRIITSPKDERKQVFSPLFTGYLLSLLLLGYLSLTANRNIPFAQIALIPTLPIMFRRLAEQLKLTSKSFYIQATGKAVIISIMVAALFYISVVSNRYYNFTQSPNKYGLHLNTLKNPVAAADFLEQYKIKGPAFSDYFVSSYLLYRLYPDFKSYIDLRNLDIFPAEFFDKYFELYGKPNKFYELDSTYKFNYVVLSTSQLTNLQLMLYWGEGFNVVHIDPLTVIMVRTTEENKHINYGPAASKLFTWPQEADDPAWATALTKLLNPTISYEEEDERHLPIHAGKFYNMVRNTSVALRFMRPAIQTDFAEDAEALATIGNIYKDHADIVDGEEMKKKMMDSAHMYLHHALEIDNNNADAHLGMAVLTVNGRQFAKAQEHLEAYMSQNDKNDYVYYLAGLCERNLWQSNSGGNAQEVIAYMNRSTKLNPGNEKAYLYIAEAEWAQGNRDAAREAMKKTLTPGIPWVAYEQDLHQKMKQLTGIKPADLPVDILKEDTHNHEGHNH
ncbi:MAG: tetratricopeptide repeat protein [Taibaiella sp.]|nr:tetratricopeptide repeat protein [Taibaiella sp.]